MKPWLRIASALGVAVLAAGAVYLLTRTDTPAGMAPVTAWQQGARGRVLAPGGAPCADTQVFLLPVAASNAIEAFVKRQRGEVDAPLGAGRTGADGSFRLACAVPDGPLDLCTVSDGFADRYCRSLRIHAREWLDVGDVVLQPGIVVQGQVVQHDSLAPVPGARVLLQPVNGMCSLVPPPGRERGLPAVTDRNGTFRYANAPRETTVSLVAEASGFATVHRLGLTLHPEAVNEFRIELPVALAIAGSVRDRSGRAVVGATVTAIAGDRTMPQQATASTDADGRFELPGLHAGPFRLTARAPGFSVLEQPVAAGSHGVVLELAEQGTARLQVLAADGSPVRECTVSLWHSLGWPEDALVKMAGFTEQRVVSTDSSGALLRGLPDGKYGFLVAAAGHAATMSPMVTVQAAGAVPTVTVHLVPGGSLAGRVVDEPGVPVADAIVTTVPNGADYSGALLQELVHLQVRDPITRTSVRSGSDGRFRIAHLAHGAYMLSIGHAGLCPEQVTDLEIAADREVDVGDVKLVRGVLVHGSCTVAGRPSGQVKVVIRTPLGQWPHKGPDGKTVRFFSVTAVSERDGSYQFLNPVPPGTYTISAWRLPKDNDLSVQTLTLWHPSRDLSLATGQRESVQDFDVPPR